MPRAALNGVSLYYEVVGHGPPLARGWRVVTYDVRGHGISEAPDDPAAYSQPISVADLRAL